MKIYLNLLPNERKSKIRHKRILKKIIKNEILFIFPVIVFAVFLFTINLILSTLQEGMEITYTQEQATGQYKDLAEFENNFKEFNLLSASIIEYQEKHLHWSNVLAIINSLSSEGVILHEIANKNYKVFMTGKAGNREKLIEFQNKLENSECFEDVEAPMSNFANKENVEFQMDLILNKNCLYKK